MHADPDDVAALAIDPAAVDPAVRDHVRGCASCQELEAELVAVADGVRRSGLQPLVAPPPDVRRRVLAEAIPSAGTAAPVRPAPHEPVAVLRPAGAGGRRVPVWAAGLAAAVTLVAGLGLGRLTADRAAPTEESTDVVATADLTTVEGTDPRGLARAVRAAGPSAEDDVVTLRVSAEALGDDDGIHEVWLLNVDGTRMVAVGLLAAGDDGEFRVPSVLLDRGYRIVDISVEPDDGDPTHSGVSLARGELT